MAPETIEKEILIEAPLDVVWELITEPAELRQWFADEAEVDLRVGGKGAIAFDSGQSFQLRVEAVEAPHRFAFRWVRRPGLTVREDTTLLVEFTLEAEAGGTRLRVVESGFDAIDWSDDERAEYVESHTAGWIRCLVRLGELVKTKPASRE